MNEEKKKALEIAVEQLHKAYGKGSIMKLGDHVDELAVASIPTGSLALDVALGCGGIPRGRIIEIYGPESGGKTTLALQMIAEAQKSGGIAAFIDAEHALDPKYAKAIGVELDELYISQPDCGEQALEITETLIRSGAVDLIVVDSVAALTPKAEIDGEMGDAHVGLIARLMSQACRKLTAAASSTGCTVVFINQLREKVGIMFGNTETTPGGRALKFYSSVRLEVRKIETVKRGTEAVSNKVRIKVVKNKVAPPFKEALTEITFGRGIDTIGETVDMATDAGIIRKGGAWFTLPNEEETRLQGRENVKAYYEEHDEELEKLKNVVRSKYITEDLEFVPSDDGEDAPL